MNIYIKRFVSFIIDLMITGFIGGVFGLLADKIEALNFLEDYIFYVLLLLFLFRDLYSKDGSMGKLMFKLKIQDLTKEKKNLGLRKLLRNTTNFILPIELIALIVSNSRISDRILELDVVDDN